MMHLRQPIALAFGRPPGRPRRATPSDRTWQSQRRSGTLRSKTAPVLASTEYTSSPTESPANGTSIIIVRLTSDSRAGRKFGWASGGCGVHGSDLPPLNGTTPRARFCQCQNQRREFNAPPKFSAKPGHIP